MRTPRFVYGAGPTTWTLLRPTGRYRNALEGTGAGCDESAALVPSTWVTQWSHTFIVPLRLLSSEWPSFRAFLMYAMQGGTFTFYPDIVGAPGTSYVCRLVSPKIDERTSPEHAEYFAAEEQEIELRRSDLQPIDFQYLATD